MKIEMMRSSTGFILIFLMSFLSGAFGKPHSKFPHEKEQKDKTALMKAIDDDSLNDVQKLIASGTDLNEVRGGLTALIEAIRKDRVEIADFLMENGAEVNTQVQHKNTACIEAARRGESKILTLLIKHGTKINSADKNGETPLMAATMSQDIDTVKILLENGSNVNAKRNDSWTALMMAAWIGDLEIVKLLLQNGADQNMKDALGETALQKALTQDHKKISEILN